MAWIIAGAKVDHPRWFASSDETGRRPSGSKVDDQCMFVNPGGPAGEHCSPRWRRENIGEVSRLRVLWCSDSAGPDLSDVSRPRPGGGGSRLGACRGGAAGVHQAQARARVEIWKRPIRPGGPRRRAARGRAGPPRPGLPSSSTIGVGPGANFGADPVNPRSGP